jgi:hypothetical protein
MFTLKSQFAQQVSAAITLAFVLGALSMIWPAIIAVFLGILMLLQSFGAEPEIARLSWSEVDNVSIVIGAFLRPGLLAVRS